MPTIKDIGEYSASEENSLKCVFGADFFRWPVLSAVWIAFIV
jgi:hypothetical protein